MENLEFGQWLTHNKLGECQFVQYDNELKSMCTIDINGMWHHVYTANLTPNK